MKENNTLLILLKKFSKNYKNQIVEAQGLNLGRNKSLLKYLCSP
jgi:hypothetical protein